jgi:hypothetical protein
LAGDWDFAMELWLDPFTPPVETRGKSKCESILGGRFLQESLSGVQRWPSDDGEFDEASYEARAVYGYDRFKKAHFGSWIDGSSTQMLTFRGAADSSGKVITYYGEMDEPLLGLQDMTVKYVRRILGPDKHTLEIFDLSQGENPRRMLLTTYTRTRKQ